MVSRESVRVSQHLPCIDNYGHDFIPQNNQKETRKKTDYVHVGEKEPYWVRGFGFFFMESRCRRKHSRSRCLLTALNKFQPCNYGKVTLSILRWLHIPTYRLSFGSWLSRLTRSTLQWDTRTVVTSILPPLPPYLPSFYIALPGERGCWKSNPSPRWPQNLQPGQSEYAIKPLFIPLLLPLPILGLGHEPMAWLLKDILPYFIWLRHFSFPAYVSSTRSKWNIVSLLSFLHFSLPVPPSLPFPFFKTLDIPSEKMSPSC